MMNVRNQSFTSALVALIVAVSMSTQSGGREPSTRLVRVNGTRLHLRSDVPVQLDHTNVITHLKRGTLLAVDSFSIGISHTGVGLDGTWLHVTSVDDPTTAGWVSARYVAEIAVPVPAGSEHLAVTTAAVERPAAAPAAPAIVIVPIGESSEQAMTMANSLLGIASSLMNMFVLFVTTFGMRWIFERFAPRPAYIYSYRGAKKSPLRKPPVGGSSTSNFYGKGWWVSSKQVPPRRDR